MITLLEVRNDCLVIVYVANHALMKHPILANQFVLKF